MAYGSLAAIIVLALPVKHQVTSVILETNFVPSDRYSALESLRAQLRVNAHARPYDG